MSDKTKDRRDPIEVASHATNTGNAHRKAERLYRQGWRDLQEQAEHKKFLAEHWRPCIKKLRDAFRSEFRAKAWVCLSIEWYGHSYMESGITRKTSPWLHYRASWKGMFFERHFAPRDLADVHIEAWKLGAVLAAWNPKPPLDAKELREAGRRFASGDEEAARAMAADRQGGADD